MHDLTCCYRSRASGSSSAASSPPPLRKRTNSGRCWTRWTSALSLSLSPVVPTPLPGFVCPVGCPVCREKRGRQAVVRWCPREAWAATSVLSLHPSRRRRLDIYDGWPRLAPTDNIHTSPSAKPTLLPADLASRYYPGHTPFCQNTKREKITPER